MSDGSAVVRRYVEKISTDPHFFMAELWKDRKLDKFWPLTDLEHDYIDWVFGVGSKAKRRRRIALAWRNFGKTLMMSGLVLYRARRDRNRKFLLNSKSGGHAKKTVGVIRQFVEVVPFLDDLCPQPGDLDNALDFNFAGVDPHRQPSVTALGIGGQLEGNHVHTIIGDDIETKMNSKTLDARVELRRLVAEYTNILEPYIEPASGGPVDPPEVIIPGTPKHEETIYLDLARANPETGKKLYRIRGWPIRVPLEGENTIALAPYVTRKVAAGLLKPGDPLMPSRFGPDEITDRESEGRHEFRREQMLAADLGDAGRYPLQLKDLLVLKLHRDLAPVSIVRGFMDRGQSTQLNIPALGPNSSDAFYRPMYIDTVVAPYQRTICAIDPAGAGEDKIAATCFAILNGMFFCKGLISLSGGCTNENLIQLALFARQHNATSVYFEPNADTLKLFSSVFQPVLQQFFTEPGDPNGHPDGWACSIEDSKVLWSHGGGASTFKENRIIDTIHVVSSVGRLIIDESVAMHQEWQRQYTRIRREKGCLGHDDELDVFAMGIQAVRHELRVDTGKAAASLMETEIDDILAAAEAEMFGHTVREPNYFTPHTS